MNRTNVRLGWLVAVMGAAALACTCGLISGLGQAQQTMQTAQAIASEVPAIATEMNASGFMETAEALATEAESSGFAATAEALATQAEGGESLFGEPPEDIPVLEDHENLFGMTDVVSYSTKTEYKKVVEFYKAEMPGHGWKEAPGSSEVADAAVLYYEKDDRKATVTVTGAAGQTIVLVSIESK